MGIPTARAMEKKKRVAVLAWIFGIQRIDPGSCRQHQLFVTCHPLLVGILEIREQGKVQEAVPVREESDFEGLKEIVDASRMLEERRNQNRIAALREQVAELRGAAQPTLAAVERLLHALEGGRR